MQKKIEETENIKITLLDYVKKINNMFKITKSKK